MERTERFLEVNEAETPFSEFIEEPPRKRRGRPPKKKKQEEPKKEKEKAPEIDLSGISGLIGEAWNILFVRIFGEERGKLTESEKQSIGDATAAVIDKYMPTLIEKYGEEFNLCCCLVALVTPRFLSWYSERKARAKQHMQEELSEGSNE